MSTDVAENRIGIKKLRVVIGLFEQPSNLIEALEALMDKGFSSAGLCVSGTIDTMSMAGSMLHTGIIFNPALVALFTRTEPYLAIEGTHTIVGSQGSLFSTLNGQRRKNDSSSPCDECSKISAELVTHIEQAGFVLVVDVDEPRRLIHASKILLKFSPYVVQTHEFLLT